MQLLFSLPDCILYLKACLAILHIHRNHLETIIRAALYIYFNNQPLERSCSYTRPWFTIQSRPANRRVPVHYYIHIQKQALPPVPYVTPTVKTPSSRINYRIHHVAARCREKAIGDVYTIYARKLSPLRAFNPSFSLSRQILRARIVIFTSRVISLPLLFYTRLSLFTRRGRGDVTLDTLARACFMDGSGARESFSRGSA